jgi:hypothetical protein
MTEKGTPIIVYDTTGSIGLIVCCGPADWEAYNDRLVLIGKRRTKAGAAAVLTASAWYGGQQ